MTYLTKNKLYEEMYLKYQDGYSLAQVGDVFGMTRQSVYCGFKRRKFILRIKKKLKHLMFNNVKFTPQNNGYYRNTNRKKDCLMHRYVWEFHNGNIPKGFDIHHKDRDKSNNIIKNLEMIEHGKHASKYSTGNNQYTKKEV